MGLSGWTWLTSGGIVGILSGYIYLFIPKNGEKNTSMAFFFFIGMIFITIGIIKLFFRRMDDKSVMESITKQPEQKIITVPDVTKTNKVEEKISEMLRQQETKEVSQKAAPAPSSAPMHKNHTSHTNSFAHMYQYKGPVHTSTTSNTQHPWQ